MFGRCMHGVAVFGQCMHGVAVFGHCMHGVAVHRLSMAICFADILL